MIKTIGTYQTPPKWGVLCIDVWENNGVNNKFYQRAIDELKNFDVACVVNCTRDIKIDYTDASVLNTFKNYQWNPTKSSAELNQQVMSNLIKASGLLDSSSILKDQLFGECSVYLNDVSTFTQHIDLFYPEVKNWVVVSTTWNEQLHHGTLGLEKMLNIPTASFNIFPQWSVQKPEGTEVSTEDLENDSFVWAEVSNDVYRLITKMGGKWQN